MSILPINKVKNQLKISDQDKEIETLSFIIAQSTEGIGTCDLNGNITFINPAWAKMHGYSYSQKFFGNNLSIFHTKKQMEDEVAPFNRKVLKFGTNSGEVGHMKRNGEVFTGFMNATALKDAKGKVCGLVASVIDITEKKKAEAAMLNSELRYRRLFETAQDGILILDAVTGEITDANPYIKKILDFSLKELIGKKLWEIGLFRDISESKTAFEELKAKKFIRYRDLPLETKEGRKVDVEFVSNSYLVGSKKVIQCNIRDISDRVKAEMVIKKRTGDLERLNEKQRISQLAILNVLEDLEKAKKQIETEKAKDEAMLDSIGEGLIAVDNDRRIMTMNKAATKMLGWQEKELIGHLVTNLPLVDDSGKPVTTKKRPTYIALKSGKSVDVNHLFFIRKNKTRFPIAINVTPIKLGKKIIGAIDIFRDITKESEINRAKSEFVSLASHQLRTPLGISKWYLEAIIKEEFFKHAPESSKNYLNEVYVSVERLIALVDDLLSVSRIDQGKVRDLPSRVNVSQSVTKIVSEMSILAKKDKITIEQIYEPKTPLINIDSRRFQEVIENLLTNAILYSHPKGVVSVTIKTEGKYISIAVQDRGVGISENDQQYIFSRFFRAANAVSKNAEGSGLGLYVVKSYVDAWGGKITVNSVENEGTTVTIYLPLESR